MMRDVKKDFPLLEKKIDGNRIVYLDSTATALKPRSVVDALNKYYTKYTANVFRGIYPLSEKATAEYEGAREKVADFINAASLEEVIFTRSTTEAINLVAYSWGRLNVGKGDEIATTVMEHHSNFGPYQQLSQEVGATLRVIDIADKNGELDVCKQGFTIHDSRFRKALGGAKLLAITHVSNVLGTINPVKQIVDAAKKINPEITILIDGAQAAPHMPVDVEELGCDFYAFSGHKMLGPTGIGVLWARKELLEEMAPFNFGGEMISEVHLGKTKYKEPPHKFEAGTPHIAGAIGLGAAVDYLSQVGMDRVREHEVEIVGYALKKLKKIKGVEIYGPDEAEKRGGVLAFNVMDKGGKIIHPHDVSQILAGENICIRAGHHCAQPLAERLGIPASARASFYIYNSEEDVDMLTDGVKKVIHKFV